MRILPWRRSKGFRPKVRRAIPVLQNLFILRSFPAIFLPIGFHAAAALLSWFWWARGNDSAIVGLATSCLISLYNSQQPGRPSYVDVPPDWRVGIDYILRGGSFRYDRAGDRWIPLSENWQVDTVRIETRSDYLRLYSTKGVLEDVVFLARRFSVDGTPDVDAMREHDRHMQAKGSNRRMRLIF